MVRAKFRVSKIEDQDWGDKKVRTVRMYPVWTGSEENKRFFGATPGGEIVLGCANLSAAEQFTEGAEFYVDFTPSE